MTVAVLRDMTHSYYDYLCVPG